MMSTGNKSLVNSTKNSTQILLNVSARKDVLSGISTSLRKTPRTACFEAQVNLIIMQPSDLLRKKMKGQITAAAGSKRLGREQGTLSSSANLVKSLPPIPKTREEKEPLDRSAKARAEVLETIAEHKKLTDMPSQKQDACGIESRAKASIAEKREMRMVRPGEVKLVELTKGEREPSVRGVLVCCVLLSGHPGRVSIRRVLHVVDKVCPRLDRSYKFLIEARRDLFGEGDVE